MRVNGASGKITVIQILNATTPQRYEPPALAIGSSQMFQGYIYLKKKVIDFNLNETLTLQKSDTDSKSKARVCVKISLSIPFTV